MNTFKNSKTLYALEYLSSLNGEGDNLVYVNTYISKEDNSYISDIIMKNLITDKERAIIRNGFQNTYPIINEENLFYLSNLNGNKQVYRYDFKKQQNFQLTFSNTDIVYYDVLDAHSLAFVTSLPLDFDNYFFWKEITEEKNKEDEFYRIENMAYLADGVGFINPDLQTYLCIQDLKTQEVHLISDISRGYNMRRFFSSTSNGKQIYYEKALCPKDDYNSDSGIYNYDRVTNKINHLTNHYSTGIFAEPSISPDGKNIAFIGNELPYETPNQNNLYLLNTSTGMMKNLSDENGYDIQFCDNSVSDIYQNITAPLIQWTNDSSTFYVTSSEYGNVKLYLANLKGELKEISPTHAVLKEYFVSKSNTLFAFTSYPDKPVMLEKYDGQIWHEITTKVSEYYSTFNYGKYQEVEYEAEDGGIIHGILCTPANFNPEEKYPLILNIHGGPYTMHAWNFYHEVQHMLANGYLVLLVNPRGSFGYGQKHAYGVYQRYGKEDYSDLMTALDKVIENHSFVDDTRLFVTGGSYGGFMTNWIITKTKRFKAAVSQRSMSNFLSMFGTSDIGYFFYKNETGYDISCPNRLWELSPLAYVENVSTPILLIHALKDLRCPFEQAQQFYIALKHYNKVAEMLVFPNSHHELSRSGLPSYRVTRLNSMIEWFDRYQ